MLLTLLSLAGGGFMRLLPEFFALINKRTDNQHELAMLDKQAELEKTRASARQEEITTQGNFADMLAVLDAQKEALKGQMQLTNIRIVDALNFLVRPAVTYFIVLMYALAKVAMFAIAMRSGLGGWDAILKVYDENDRAILAGILAYWFVGRDFSKQKQ